MEDEISAKIPQKRQTYRDRKYDEERTRQTESHRATSRRGGSKN